MSETAAPFSSVTRGSTIIAAFTTIVEWYDFTLYLYFATVLSRVFFGAGAESLLIALAGFAVLICCGRSARFSSGISATASAAAGRCLRRWR